MPADETPRCRAQYPPSRPEARIIRCDLEAGHPGEHEEADTEVTWLASVDETPERTADYVIPEMTADEVAALDAFEAELRAQAALPKADERPGEADYLAAAEAYDRRDDPADLEPPRSATVLGNHPPFRAAIDDAWRVARAPLLAKLAEVDGDRDAYRRERNAYWRERDQARAELATAIRERDEARAKSMPDGGTWIEVRRCEGESEPEGYPCVGFIAYGPRDVQARCSMCGGWEGRRAPGHDSRVVGMLPVAVETVAPGETT
jgi:hypothetical protein